jgi:hypothetical protein
VLWVSYGALITLCERDADDSNLTRSRILMMTWCCVHRSFYTFHIVDVWSEQRVSVRTVLYLELGASEPRRFSCSHTGTIMRQPAHYKSLVQVLVLCTAIVQWTRLEQGEHCNNMYCYQLDVSAAKQRQPQKATRQWATSGVLWPKYHHSF